MQQPLSVVMKSETAKTAAAAVCAIYSQWENFHRYNWFSVSLQMPVSGKGDIPSCLQTLCQPLSVAAEQYFHFLITLLLKTQLFQALAKLFDN